MRIHKFDSVVTLTCLTLLGYFAWHAFEGPRGFKYRDKWALQSDQLTGDLAATTEKRTKFEQRVALLRPESVDPDLLDELARTTLDVALQNELIILDKP